MKRIRLCRNPKCRHTFATKELIMREDSDSRDLFSDG
jgi:hypothetical protein